MRSDGDGQTATARPRADPHVAARKLDPGQRIELLGCAIVPHGGDAVERSRRCRPLGRERTALEVQGTARISRAWYRSPSTEAHRDRIGNPERLSREGIGVD